MSGSEIRERRVPAHPSVCCLDHLSRIADAGGNDSWRAGRRLLAEKVSKEISGRKPVVYVSHGDAAARTWAAAVNATM